MDVYNVTPTQLYCPNCGYKVTGYNDRNAVLRRTCPKCRVAIISKLHKQKGKEIDIKVIGE